jgi:UDP-N-acetylmuramoyl-L-alanyl-D-glutamate--2,6-diaminopimelate ligase
MGKIAENLADRVIITSDNPRTEDPQSIVQQVYQGVKNTGKVKLIIDRKKAIKDALKKAEENDTVVIAGKGHEDYQILGKRKIHFSDREEVERFFKEKKLKNPKVLG